MSERNRLLRIGMWCAAAMLAAWWVAVHTKLRSDPSAMIPHRLDEPGRLLMEQIQQGPASRMILLAISGGTLEGRVAASRALAERLRGDGRLATVSNGERAPDENLARILFEYRYLLRDLSEADFSGPALREALHAGLRELRSPLSPLHSRLLPADPTGEMARLLAGLTQRREPARAGGVWVSPDHSQALLIAETPMAGLDLDGQRERVAAIEGAFAAVRTDAAAALRLSLSGPAVLALAVETRIRNETTLLGLVATLGLLALLHRGYGSGLALLYGSLPGLGAVLFGAAALGVFYGEIHAITLALGITLLDVAIDYPLHLFSHGPAALTKGPLQGLGGTLALSVVTTAVAFGSLLFSGLPGLEQLGALTLVGLLAAWTITLHLLPALPGVSEVRRRPLPMPTWGWLPRRARAALPAVLLGVAVLLLSTRPAIWEDDIGALSPVPQPLLTQDRALREALGAPDVGQALILIGEDREMLLQRSEDLAPRIEELVAAGAIAGAETLTAFLPSLRTQTRRQQALPAVEQVSENLVRAQVGLPFKPNGFAPFLGDLKRTKTMPPLTAEVFAGTSLGLKLDALLGRSGAHWTLLIPLHGVRAPALLAAHFAERPLAGVSYLDVRAQTSRLVAGFRDRALRQMALGGALLSLVLLAVLRSLRRTARVLLPVVLALILDVTLLAAWGQRLSLFHLVSLLLVFGVSLDYSLFAHRAGTGDAATDSAAAAHALTLCMASTVLVFGLLAWSEIPVLRAIGLTVAIGVAAAYLLVFALAPAPASGSYAT